MKQEQLENFLNTAEHTEHCEVLQKSKGSPCYKPYVDERGLWLPVPAYCVGRVVPDCEYMMSDLAMSYLLIDKTTLKQIKELLEEGEEK